MSELRKLHYALREKIVLDIERDFVGPVEQDEALEDPPVERYSAGMLFPGDAAMDSIDDQATVDTDSSADGGAPDPGVSRSSARYPTSAGITFALASDVKKVRVEVGAARYAPVAADGHGSEKWQRRQVAIEPLELELDVTPGKRTPVTDGLEIYTRVRDPDDRGTTAVTLVLCNTFVAGRADLRDEITFFQVSMAVRDFANQAIFLDRAGRAGLADDVELESSRLLYRHVHSFAVGHGCSAAWIPDVDEPDRAKEVSVRFMPAAPVNVAISNPSITSEALAMRFCATASIAELSLSLTSFVDEYESWVKGLDLEAADLEADLKTAAVTHIASCETAVTRLRGAVVHLETDAASLKAFRLMNDAMGEQRRRAVWLQAGNLGDPPPGESTGKWYPFQLAFVLLALEGIANEESDERDIADLLWFPTGGGKTEAYLGLIAFTLFRRRLTRPDSEAAGVTVIMRYTLRLLTMQQFARAALLICCCEDLRRRTRELGNAAIELGLWVGGGGTPNDRATAADKVKELKRGVEPTEGNPRQLQACPWCGNGLNYWMGDRPARLNVSCTSNGCDFKSRLPVQLIDDDIYDYRPSVIIATVDKFAALPWTIETRSIFGIGTASRPPELIIQDELHLISGPLGTLTGLYETAVDLLCTSDNARPKVIASTATIRRADDQASHLFDRKLAQFPPAGLTAKNSYFAIEADPEERGNRLYLGAMATSTSQASALIRIYSRLLATLETDSSPPEVKDPYWTLLGYFNSLRILGAARMQTQDDVPDRMEFLLKRPTTRELSLVEMTSRVSSGEISEQLSALERKLGDPEGAVDVVLATNMISVGVDVNRLGLMAVMGQPQATAEYIQATSRVGRAHPGLVISIFNATRSRDRSHYESFGAFHGALYREVESSSVTPFASRARDRALHAVFIALCRLTITGLAENSDAANISQFRSDAVSLRDRILLRVQHVDSEQYSQAESQIDDLISRWESMAANHPDLVYKSHPKDRRTALLTRTSNGRDLESMHTLDSLRDVDLETTLVLR